MNSSNRLFHAFLPPTSLSFRPRSSPARFVCTAPPPYRTAAITGASGGIGLETAKGLIRTLPQLEHLYLLVRNVAKTEQAVTTFPSDEIGNRHIPVTILPVELSSATSVSKCADELLSRLNVPLDLLICNAGIMATPLMYTSNNGGGEFERIEMQYAVNHLSHALLTEKLKPSLTTSPNKGRVIFVSSLALNISRNRKHAPLISERTEQSLRNGGYGKWKMYGDSKLAMSLYARALADMNDVEAVSLHPGVVNTELSRYLFPGINPDSWLSKVLAKVLRLRTPEEGARLSVDLSGKQSVKGEFFADLDQVDTKSAPMLQRSEEVERCYQDTLRFVNAFR